MTISVLPICAVSENGVVSPIVQETASLGCIVHLCLLASRVVIGSITEVNILCSHLMQNCNALCISCIYDIHMYFLMPTCVIIPYYCQKTLLK